MRRKWIQLSTTCIKEKIKIDSASCAPMPGTDYHNADCKARLTSFAFGVFLYSKINLWIHCRGPPFINL